MKNIQNLHQLAQQALNNRDYVKAHAYCVEIIQQEPQHADSYFLLGMVNVEVGQIQKAIALIHKAIEISSSLEYLSHLSKCYALQGKKTEAVRYANLVSVEKVNNPLTLDTLGVALSRVGSHIQALEYFEKALSLTNNNPAFYYNFAVSCKFAGLFAKAREAFEQAIKLKPNYAQAHFALSDLGGITQQNNHIERLEVASRQIDHPDDGLHYGHALAKEYEALGLYEQAFQILNQVKQAKLCSLNYDISQDVALFAASQPNTNRQPPVAKTRGSDSHAPIFVVGMPRSGTTLVERILSNHTQVDSCGELQDFGVAVKEVTNTASAKILDVETLTAAQNIDMRQLGERYIERTKAVRGQAERFVDKLPFNFFYINLILDALPNAKIVWVQRNAMDTCIGNFRQLFSINSPYYAYAYDLQNIGMFYQQFYRLGQAWSEKNVKNLLVLNYEQLVKQPEEEVKSLLDFCKLDWQPQCIQVENNQAPVSTASKVQVREKINTRSIGRWQKFRKSTLELQAYFKQHAIPFE
ncbi:sulfotransferase [Paraglaciecola aquimarina]|uniref:Sulfotransferase n=1 Tax=Paraglaciecola algarum TaxID=3050085 RepID=A0ABS9D8U9_9ALTE|nr:sulfotransferase [Paraglaciecola sp. G1-23]MCF2948086.1 sulfotransferase [Paraglaciecola sp. G1-23]